MNLPSVMNHAFSKIPAPDIQRSVFDRSHGHKTTFNTGYLIPVFLDEVLPGDTISMRASFMARLATLLYPIMDNVFLDTFWFYCPNRILWDNWERLNGAQATPSQSIDVEVPWMSELDPDPADTIEFGPMSLGDYFGLPTQVRFPEADAPSALPFRMYNRVWNEWFRDQNTQGQASQVTADGPDISTNYALLRRGKRHDYFTSCLPWPQKGDGVMLPLGVSAPVVGNGTTIGLGDEHGLYGLQWNQGNSAFEGSTDNYGAPVGTVSDFGTPSTGYTFGLTGDPDNSGMIADLTMATAATVNQLREAFAVQQVLERDARGGTRYTEIIKSHFGVTVQDFRLQRPEYLGGSSQRVGVSTVAQTSESAGTPQANLAAYGQVGTQSGFHKSFDEHGWVMCLVNVRADISYQQGLNKMWSRRTRYDFYLPSFAHLGEQAVLNKEIMMGTSTETNNQAFGYQERWAEMRYKQSMVTGAFRSNYATSLDAWHLALDFDTLPALDSAFMVDVPPFDRVMAVDDSLEPQILLDSYYDYKHARPMPVYSTPGLERL